MNTGLKNPFVRWWVAGSIMIVAVVTALLAGVGSFILDGDRTFLSWAILSIFFVATGLLGYKTHVKGVDADHGIIEFFAETCTALGLLGTIIGLIMMISGAFVNLDATDHEAMQAALGALSSGIATALITTLVGLISALLLKVQLAVVREKWGA